MFLVVNKVTPYFVVETRKNKWQKIAPKQHCGRRGIQKGVNFCRLGVDPLFQNGRPYVGSQLAKRNGGLIQCPQNSFRMFDLDWRERVWPANTQRISISI